MSEIQEQAVPETEAPDSQGVIEKLKEDNARLRSEHEKLANKRTEAMDEAKKLKRIRNLVSAIGIDYEAEDAETMIAERLLAAPNGASASEPAIDAGTDGNAASKPGPDPLVEAEMARMRRQLEALTKANQIAEEEKAAAIAKNRADRIERQVVDALQKAGAANPSHAYRLMALDSKYKVDLTEEGSVVGGPDYDPKPLSDVVAAFRDDENFQYMFNGTGMSGAGSGARSGGASPGTAINPFRVDQLNVTSAATIYQQNPEKAKRLMGEARSAGKLDPKFANLAKA